MAMTKAANARQHPASRKDEQREMARQEQELASTPLPGEGSRRVSSPAPATETGRTESPTTASASETDEFPATPPSAEVTEAVEAALASNVVAMTTRAPREVVAPPQPEQAQPEQAAPAEVTGPASSAPASDPAPDEAAHGAEQTDTQRATDDAPAPQRVIAERAPAARATRSRSRVTEGDLKPSLALPSGSQLLAGLELIIPDTPPANVARVKASKRGKRDVNYSWPKVDYAAMQEAWKECKPVYSRFWRHKDPGGAYRLGFSAFVAKAMLVAFEDVDAWVGTIRNDGRLEPVPGGRQQVGLVWPVEVENQVIDLWETLDRAKFPADFSLTKQHLAAAAILHGLKSVSQWLLESDNDDRFSIPVEADGRLRANRVEIEDAPV